jgi:hypothetical protein
VIDNGGPGTSYTGTWTVSAGTGYYGANSVYAMSGSTYKWSFTPTLSGSYQVSMRWTVYSTRSTAVPVDITHSGGTARVTINQQLNGGKWNVLGRYSFTAGQSYTVTITSQPGPSSTCADAVKFVPVSAGDPPPAGEVVIDNGGPGTSYTGTWGVSGATGSYGTPSVWSRDGSKYTWTFTPAVSGSYQLSMWWTAYSTRSTAVPVDILHALDISRVTINQKLNGGKWNVLGRYSFLAGESYTVTITSQPGPSSTCADAVKFTPL